MNWAQIGGIAAALIAVVAALYFFGLGGVLRVMRAVAGFFGDVAEGVRKWLKTPGNKVRGLCALFGFAFLAAGLQSWQRGTVIVQQRADYTALKEKTDAEKAELAGRIQTRDQRIAEFTALANRQKALLAQAQLESQAQIEALREAKRQAALSEAKYQEAFKNKTPECATALEVMARACPALSGY